GGLGAHHEDGLVADDDAGVRVAFGGVGVGVVGQFLERHDLVGQVGLGGELLAHGVSYMWVSDAGHYSPSFVFVQYVCYRRISRARRGRGWAARAGSAALAGRAVVSGALALHQAPDGRGADPAGQAGALVDRRVDLEIAAGLAARSEEHTSELQS